MMYESGWKQGMRLSRYACVIRVVAVEEEEMGMDY